MPEINLALVVAAVIGVSQWLKERLGVQDKAAEVMSFIVGLAGGGAYQVFLFPPASAQDWFGAVIVAVLMALVPSGLYKFGGAMAGKIGTGRG